MSRNPSKRPQRAFPWRETFLAALRQDPRVTLACKVAGISRNSAYEHYRRYPVFRRQWERVVEQAREAAYQLHEKQLVADRFYERMLERVWGNCLSDAKDSR